MKILILTEGGKNIGFGHLTRCIALAEVFIAKHLSVKLIVDGDKSIGGLLKNGKYKVCNWMKNTHMIFEHYTKGDVIIIDSYKAGKNNYKRIASFAKTAVYIDDSKRLNYPKGIVINGMLYAKELKYPVNNKIFYLLGPKYALIRKGFFDTEKKNVRKIVKIAMITFGGTNNNKLQKRILSFLKEKFPQIKSFFIIRNNANKYINSTKHADNATIVTNPTCRDIKKIMHTADIAISAGGQTLNELAVMGVPAIGVCISKNQEMNLQKWHNAGLLEFVGWHNDPKLLIKLQNALNKLMDYKTRKKMLKKSKAIMDTKGAQRVAEAILKKCRK